MAARRTATAMVIAAALVACGSDGGAELVAGPAVLVTNDGVLSAKYEAASLLFDRDEPNTVYLSAVELEGGTCRFFASADGGRTWDTELPAPGLEPFTNCSMGAAQPQNIRTELRQASDGTLYYAFHANDPAAGGGRSVLLGRSRDGGRSWQTTAVHAAPTATTPGEVEVNFEPHVAIDETDPRRVYVAWRRSYPRVEGQPRRPTRPWMAVSEDGGATFGEPFMMVDRDIGFDAPRLIVRNGRLHAFYREAPPRAEGGPPQPTRLLAAISTDGRNWEETEITTAGDASEPVPVFEPRSGRFVVVWHDNRNGDLDVFVSVSADATSWSRPVRLNDDPEGNGIGQYYPQIAAGPDGRVDVAWYDYRDDPYPAPVAEDGEPLTLFSNLGRVQNVYHTRSTDGAVTWSDNLRVSDVPINRTVGTWNADYFVVVPVAVAAGENHTAVAWSDTRLGDATTGRQDIAVGSVAPPVAASDTPALLLAGLAGLVGGAGIAMGVAAAVMRRRGHGEVDAPAEPEPRVPAGHGT